MTQPLYNWKISMSHYISDHQTCGQKKPGKRRSDGVAVLRQAHARARGRTTGTLQSSTWDEVPDATPLPCIPSLYVEDPFATEDSQGVVNRSNLKQGNAAKSCHIE